MAIAYLAAKRSKDPVTQVGACIVNKDERIVGIGYNAMPKGCSKFPWVKNKADPLKCKLTYVAHAELNAIVHKNVTDENCTLYVTLFPCKKCAKLIIRSGIKKVVFGFMKPGPKKKDRESRCMLEEAGVKLQKYTRKRQNIVIDFTKIDRIQHEESAGTSKRTSETADVETKQCNRKRKRDQISSTKIEGIQVPSTSLEEDPHE